jgi:Beta-ketoacyl synthase, N-terminal domain
LELGIDGSGTHREVRSPTETDSRGNLKSVSRIRLVLCRAALIFNVPATILTRNEVDWSCDFQKGRNILSGLDDERPPEALRSAQLARFRVEDWMACGPGLETREDWLAWSHGAKNPGSDVAQAVPSLPPILRRRISIVGQRAFRASCALLEQRTARFVFCSRYGESDRTLRILRSLAVEEPISPADFSLSVHNALAGLLSIAWGNTAGHTAISAGADSFGYGLLEAIACLKEGSGEPVMLVYFDDLPPKPYDEVVDGAEGGVALAMLLRPPSDDRHEFAISLEPRSPAATSQSASSQALDFLRFMLSNEREKRSIGERTLWCWQRCD